MSKDMQEATKKLQEECCELTAALDKKNEEFKAFEHEIATCKGIILTLDDQQIELMEQIETAQKAVAAANKNLADSKKVVDSRITDIGAREGNLNKELAELQSNRDELAAPVGHPAPAVVASGGLGGPGDAIR